MRTIRSTAAAAILAGIGASLVGVLAAFGVGIAMATAIPLLGFTDVVVPAPTPSRCDAPYARIIPGTYALPVRIG